ncbi:MAG: TrmH family RNA methyltransferase [Vicinamibacterales bacterium]
MPFAATTLGSRYARIETLPVRVLLHSIRSLHNVGAFFRTADAVRAEAVLLSGITGRPPRREISKTALGAEEVVPWTAVDDAAAAVESLRRDGYEVAAIETRPRAVDLFDWQPRFPVCVMFGHEVEGLEATLVERADTCVRLPMLGRKHSLNVATAGGVVLFELLRKYRMSIEGRP